MPRASSAASAQTISGAACHDRLQADGVDSRNVAQMAHAATAVAFVTYFDDGSRKFIKPNNAPAVLGDLTDAAAVRDPAFFHVMGCSLMANDAFRAHFRYDGILPARGAKISFDPNIRPELLGERAWANWSSVVGEV